MKRVRTWSFSGPYFTTFELNTDIYSVSHRFQTYCGKIRTTIGYFLHSEWRRKTTGIAVIYLKVSLDIGFLMCKSKVCVAQYFYNKHLPTRKQITTNQSKQQMNQNIADYVKHIYILDMHEYGHIWIYFMSFKKFSYQ